MISALRSAAFAALLVGIVPAAAAAQAPAPPPSVPPAAAPAPPPPPPPGPAPSSLISEMKIGILAHDVGFLGHHVEGGADVNFEMLFTPPEIFRAIGSPRPTIGGEVNTSGNTDDAYFGLTWGITLIQNLFGWGGSVFANGTLGGAVQDGFTNHAPPGRKELGSPVLFHLGAELGYQMSPTVSVSAFLDHMSNANLAPHNAGITNAGARLGFKF